MVIENIEMRAKKNRGLAGPNLGRIEYWADFGAVLYRPRGG